VKTKYALPPIAAFFIWGMGEMFSFSPRPPSSFHFNNTIFRFQVVQDMPSMEASGEACDQDAITAGTCKKFGIVVESAKEHGDEQDTAFHELLHILLGTNESDVIVTRQEFAKKLSPRLLSVIRENPALVKYLETERWDSSKRLYPPMNESEKELFLRKRLLSLLGTDSPGNACTYHQLIYRLSPERKNIFRGDILEQLR